MKINFQPFLYPISYKTPVTRKEHHNNKILTVPDYVSFSSQGQDFDLKMENLSDIHCPSCGVEMLPKKLLYKFMEKSKDIKNLQELIEFVEDKKKFINKNFINVLDELTEASKMISDDRLSVIVPKAKEIREIKIRSLFDEQQKYLENLIQKGEFSENDISRLKLCKSEIAKLRNNELVSGLMASHSDILRYTIYEMDSNEKWKISKILKTGIFDAYIPKLAYRMTDICDENLIAYYLVRNIFGYSTSTMIKIPEEIDTSDNYCKILLCRQCDKNRKHNIINLLNPDKEHLEYYKTYITDISKKSLEGALGEDNLYPLFMHGYMKKISYDALDIRGTEANALLKKPRFLINKTIDFDLVDIDGIPCACCGQPTITHQKKLEINDRIAQAKDKFEILQILDENRDIIRGRYLPIVNCFEKILKENPNISDKEVFDALKVFAKERLKKSLMICQNYAKNLIESGRYNSSEIIRLQQYINNVDKYYINTDYEGMFDFSGYGKMVNKTLSPISRTRRGKIIEILRYSVKEKMAGQYILYPLNKVVEEYDSPLKVIAQDIIKNSVATKDHFVAKQLTGSDDKNNLVVLCKSCNTFKSNSTVYDWIKRDKRIIQNFQSYFNFIIEGIKTGKIDSSKAEYLKELQMAAYDASKGKMDIEYNPDFML